MPGTDGARAPAAEPSGDQLRLREHPRPRRRDDLRVVVERTTRAVADRCGPFDHGGVRRGLGRRSVSASSRRRSRRCARSTSTQRSSASSPGCGACPRRRGHDRWDDAGGRPAVEPGRDRLRGRRLQRGLRRGARRRRRRSGRSLPGWPSGIASGSARTGRWPQTIERYVEARRLGAAPPGGRRLAAGRDDQAGLPDLPGRRGGARDVAGPAILHVGDDWAADVVGARRAGWRAAWLRDRPGRLAAARERTGRRTAATARTSSSTGPGRLEAASAASTLERRRWRG